MCKKQVAAKRSELMALGVAEADVATQLADFKLTLVCGRATFDKLVQLAQPLSSQQLASQSAAASAASPAKQTPSSATRQCLSCAHPSLAGW